MNDPFALLEQLRAAGLKVRQYGGWATRGGRWLYDTDDAGRPLPLGRPSALMIHHTAKPVPFPVRNLAGMDDNRIKCNINVKPDGTLWLVAFGACNYSSGPGVGTVLDDLDIGILPPANAADRGWTSEDDDTNGNEIFWNFEVDHIGNGSAIPPAQLYATAVAARVVAHYFAMVPDLSTISHAEWTARKRDPFWDNDPRAIVPLRNLIRKATLMQGPNGEPNWDEVSEWARAGWTWAHSQGALRENTHPADTVDKEELFTILHRLAQARD